MTPGQFISKWQTSELKERSASQEHFIDLCRLLGEPTPAQADPTGDWYCFERGARKDTGGDGWADVWKRGCFAWEYKGKRANLNAAFKQLRQYALALENPPLLIVSDMARFRIVTNWTNCVSETQTRRRADKWIVDFGWTMVREEAALYEAPFSHVKECVRPMRQRNRREAYRVNWWRHVEPRQGMWRALDGLSRFIATPCVAKHRVFVWLEAGACPDHALIVFARDDDVTFGILHSRFHEAWSLRLGTSLEDRPRYTPTTTFETFAFPDGLSPDIPASDYADDPRALAIAAASRRLVELRDRWLHPTDWVTWVDEPVPGFPKRPVARDAAAAKELKARTLTNLYNARPQWLADAHAALDTAVATAYGWDPNISESAALRMLSDLNVARDAS